MSDKDPNWLHQVNIYHFTPNVPCSTTMTSLDSDTLSNHNNDIFSSVFRPPAKAFLPANTSSPRVPTVSKDSQSAWNLVTSWLRLPRSNVASVPPVHATRRLDDALSSLLTADDTAHLLVSL